MGPRKFILEQVWKNFEKKRQEVQTWSTKKSQKVAASSFASAASGTASCFASAASGTTSSFASATSGTASSFAFEKGYEDELLAQQHKKRERLCR